MKRIYILPFLALGLASCVEDEGNYTYTDLNEVTIGAVEDSYSVMSRVGRLQINPELTATLDDNPDDYEYHWYLCSGSDHKHHTVSTDKNLDWEVNLSPGRYSLYFTVKDKKTGILTQKYTSLNVAHALTRGYLILGDLPEQNSIGLDILSMPQGMDTIMVEEAHDYSDLNLSKANKIIYSGEGYNNWNQAMWLLADDKSYRLNSGSEYSPIKEFNDMGLYDIDYSITKPAKMLDMFPHQAGANRSRSYRGYVTDEVIMVKSIIQYEYYNMPVNRYSQSSKTLYKPFPCVFYRALDSNPCKYLVFYDMDNKRFCRLDLTAYDWTYKVTIPVDISYEMADKANDEWSWDTGKEGRSIVFGQNAIGTSNYSYALMKDDATGEYLIYRFVSPTISFNVTGNTYTANLGDGSKKLYPVDKSIAIDFDKASLYLFSGNRTSVVYSVGSRLYHYDFRGMASYIDFDREITCLKQDSNGNYDQFFVATYDSQTKGKIYKMQIDNNPDAADLILLDGQEWSTRLKVKDIEWKVGNDVN